jgi:hypothetical protein
VTAFLLLLLFSLAVLYAALLYQKIQRTGPWLSSFPALFWNSIFRIKTDICGDPEPNMEVSMAARTAALSKHLNPIVPST